MISSIFTAVIIFYKVPTTIILQTVALVLVMLLLVSKRLQSSSPISNRLFRLSIIGLSSLLIQLLIISSGGLYSPFLILLHLYTLGSSFLLNLRSAFVFLLLSVLVLLVQTFSNQTLQILLRQDPGSALLYFISFVVIIPLAQYLTRTYHLKDTVSRVLTENIELGQKREELILRGLSELVLITDENLRIVSVNEAVEKTLQITKNYLSGKNLLDHLRLTDSEGNVATTQTLAIDQMQNDKASRIIEGLMLQTNAKEFTKIILQIRPIINAQGIINQIVFVITEAPREASNMLHLELERAREKQKKVAEYLKKALLDAKLPNLKLQTELFSRTEEDLLTALELEDHPIKLVESFEDLAAICEQVTLKEQEFARSMGVELHFVLPKQEIAEATLLSLLKSNFPKQNLPISEFAAPIDSRWLGLILQKLLDISILLSSQKAGIVNLVVSRPNPKSINIDIVSSEVNLSPGDEDKLFQSYFGDLTNRTNLRLGSGLEGFIVKLLAKALHIQIDIKLNNGTFNFTLVISKQPN